MSVKVPDKDGYWWWRGNERDEWKMSDVSVKPEFKARFFDGSRIMGRVWGEWKEAEVKEP